MSVLADDIAQMGERQDLPADVTNPTSVLAWEHLSSRNGDLPSPAGGSEQTASLVLDVDGDGMQDFIIGSRMGPGPSVVWFRRVADGWQRYVIESDVLRISAGGAFHDIDGDGDLDIALGEDNAGNHVWWWENPAPSFSPTTDWTRREIKRSGCNMHHDMMFGDFDGNGAAELVFWNQESCGSLRAGRLYRATIPANVKTTTAEWPLKLAFVSGAATDEGLAQADIDGDGLNDIVGGGFWFKLEPTGSFKANYIERVTQGRVAVADLIPGGRPEIVQVPGDSSGKARLYVWDRSNWIGRNLLATDVGRAHSLEIADVDGDGNLDIFIAEMRRLKPTTDYNANARTMIFFGNGQGQFQPVTVTTGYDHHESRLADLDGDGDIDILGKPFVWDTARVDIWLNGGGVVDACRPLDRWQTHVIDTSRPWRAVFIDSADLDGDGDDDIITGAWWYRNPGKPGGTWTRNAIDPLLATTTEPKAGTFNQFAAALDLDGDKDIDLLGTTWSGNANAPQAGNTIVWARNNGAGTFAIIPTGVTPAQGDFLQGVAPVSFVAGEQEIILSWHQSTLARLDALKVPADPANGTWTLRTVSTVTQSEEVNVDDIDGDGDPDILLGTKWLQNLGQGKSWKVQTPYATSLMPDRNHLADLNKDGRVDAIIGYETTQSIAKPLAWYQSPANATASWPQTIIDNPIGPMSLDVADADGDGDMDIVIGEHNLKDPTAGRVWLYENINNAASWKSHLVATGHEHHDGTQFVDLNDDNLLDIISIGWQHNQVLVYEQLACNQEPPTHTPTPPPQLTQTPTQTPTPVPTQTPTPQPGDCLIGVPSNVIQNPGFEQGIAPWLRTSAGALESSSAAAYNCDYSAQLKVLKPRTTAKFYHNGILLKPKTAYRLQFAARSPEGLTLSVNLARQNSISINYGIRMVKLKLTADWQVFVIDFTTTGANANVSDGRLLFGVTALNSAGQMVYLDDVVLAPRADYGARADAVGIEQPAVVVVGTPAPGE